MQAEEILVDVVALSKQQCEHAIQCKLAYACHENFVGRIIDGYSANAQDIALYNRNASYALCEVQNVLNKKNLGLYIYDTFRPTRAIADFSIWLSQPPVSAIELDRKAIHYPHIEKSSLAEAGYIVIERSRHSLGYAVDLTLIDLKTHELLDMGACFDYFDSLSHDNATAEQIGEVAFRNRQRLKKIMYQHGFKVEPLEYWHFDYHQHEAPEPMDLMITSELKGLNVAA